MSVLASAVVALTCLAGEAVGVNGAAPIIAIIIHGFAGGGAERAMIRLAAGLAEDGLVVDLVVGDSHGPLRSTIPKDVALEDLRRPRMRGAIVPLARYLHRRRPSAVLSAMTHVNIATLLAAALARTNARVVVSERNTLSRVAAESDRTMDKVLATLTRFLYPRADVVTAVSQGAADDLAEIAGLPRRDIRVLHNPVIDGRLLRCASESVDHPWFGSGSPPVVLGAGRLVPAKDFPTLLEAFQRVREERPARLMVLGEGPERAELEALGRKLGLEADVAFPGFVSNPYAYMKRAALFALSSRWEGMPNVLIEAAALGTPVVSTDCPNGPRELLGDGQLAPLVPVGDAENLAQAILSQLASPTALPEAALEPFTVEAAASAYREVLLGNEGAAA